VNTEHYRLLWQRTGVARGGAPFLVRPIRPDDAYCERQFIEFFRQRLRSQLCAMHEPWSSFVQQLVNVDYQQTMTLVAVVGEYHSEQIIGVGRYAAIDQQRPECEFAVAVADEWQLRGVGRILTRLLLDYAQSQGFTHTHERIFAADIHMVELAHDSDSRCCTCGTTGA
jgi:GNAT superfamily N-acetyltransferase